MSRRLLLFFFLVFALACLPLAADDQQGPDHFADVVSRSDEEGRLTLRFIDLDVPDDSSEKSGDCTLIVAPDGAVMLVDCGHPDAADDVEKVLDALGITKIDVFVMSHPHIDHIGSFPAIAAKYQIGRIYRTRLVYNTQYTAAFDEAVEENRIPVTYVADGDFFMLGSEVRVDVYNPAQSDFTYPEGYPEGSTPFVNNSSILMKLTYGESTALLGGDLYKAQERTVMAAHAADIDIDVAKADHHGYDTSNSLRWIRTITPQVVVAMHDKMASMQVWQNYVKTGAVFYHTCYNGTVKVTLDDHHGVHATPTYDSWVEKGGN